MPNPINPDSTDVLSDSGSLELDLKLIVADGPDFGAEFPLVRGTYSIGKAPDNDWVLTDSAISRTHLTVAVLAHGVRVTDNGSTNGSFCEEMRFTTLEVRVGASVRIGRTVLQLVPRAAPPPRLAPSTRERFGALAGRSLPMRQLFAVLERLAKVDTDVLIRGETGTGKDLCAQALHTEGRRKAGPFVVCDLAAVSAPLIESELFGHVKGAFTGAQKERPGLFEQATGGTIFLDEIGELPLELQPRLLRALEQRQVRRVGSNEYRAVDVRVIAATHRDLDKARQEGRFREDLFHRLAVAQIVIPPLRERQEEIPFLIDELLARSGLQPSELDASTRALLCSYGWPGNVRELRNVVERVVALGTEAVLPDASGPERSRGAADVTSLPFKEAKERLVDAFERDYLAQLLKRFGWNLSRASEEAGIARFYLRQLLKKHGLEKP